MAAKRRIVPIAVNVTTLDTIIAPDDLGTRNTLPVLARFEQAVVRWTLVDDQKAAFALAAGTTFLCGVDNVFTPGHADHVLAGNEAFNIVEDWADADPAAGKVCARIDLATIPLGTALGSTEAGVMHLVLWAFQPGEKPFLLAHSKVNVKNVAVEPIPATDLPDPSTVFATLASLYQMDHGNTVNAAGPVAVEFNTTFPDVPTIVAAFTDNADELLQIEILSRSTSGFTFQVRGAGGVVDTAYNIAWTAALNFNVASFRAQGGLAVKAAGNAFVDIAFPVAFANVPSVTVTLYGDVGSRAQCEIIARTTAGARVQVRDAGGVNNADEFDFLWLAVASNL